MKKTRFQEFLTQSLAGFGSLALAILFFFALYKIHDIFTVAGKLMNVLMPMIYGLVIAFLLSPPCNRIQDLLDRKIPSDWWKARSRHVFIKSVSVALTILATLVLIYLLLVLVIPQLFASIVNLINSVPTLSTRLTNWTSQMLASNPDLQDQVLSAYDMIGDYAWSWVQNTFLPQMQDLVSGVSVGILGFLVMLKNIVLGLIISIYLLFNRKLYTAQAKKAMYGVLPAKWANWILLLCRDVSDIFSGFILGKLLDSLIMGVLCFIIMSILKLPYSVLVSTIVGVTNIIPYFGPFIGAIPSAVLIFTVSPLQCVYFLIFILILQQTDGNVIGPKILGNSTGLSSFWVLFSLLFFGGLFGFVGMIIGVPTFAVLYDLAQRGVRYLLEKKGLPQDSRAYETMDHVDTENNSVVSMEEPRKKKRRE